MMISTYYIYGSCCIITGAWNKTRGVSASVFITQINLSRLNAILLDEGLRVLSSVAAPMCYTMDNLPNYHLYYLLQVSRVFVNQESGYKIDKSVTFLCNHIILQSLFFWLPMTCDDKHIFSF